MKKVKVIISIMLLAMVCFVCSSCGEEKYESHTVGEVEFSLPESFLEDENEKGENGEYVSYSREGEVFEINIVNGDKDKHLKASKQIDNAMKIIKEDTKLQKAKETETEIDGVKYRSIKGTADNTNKKEYDETETAETQKEAFIFIPKGYTLTIIDYIYTSAVDEEIAKDHKEKIFSSITFKGAEK